MSADWLASLNAWKGSGGFHDTSCSSDMPPVVDEYEDALSYIHGLQRYGSLRGLERIQALLDAMGNPERSVKAIHIAGTNGKGSVTAMTASAMMANGLRTGMYISPYLESFEERITIDGRPIGRGELVRLTGYARSCVESVLAMGLDHPTEFEMVTAIAFEYFAEQGVDAVSLEVGLGGRYDATNVVDPLVSVITSIGLDHQDQLGESIREIANEKAGIIKEKGIVVSAAGSEEAQEVIREVCGRKRAFLVEVGRDVTWTPLSASLKGQWFSLKSFRRSYDELFIPLVGPHQLVNAATAVTALELLDLKGIDVSETAIREGLSRTYWPGRFEMVGGDPLIILDCAHNPDGAMALASSVRELLDARHLILVVGILRDKRVEDIIGQLAPIAAEVITTEPLSPRAIDAVSLAEVVRRKNRAVTAEPSISRALAHALSVARRDDVILVAGSIYLVGEARRVLRRMGKVIPKPCGHDPG